MENRLFEILALAALYSIVVISTIAVVTLVRVCGAIEALEKQNPPRLGHYNATLTNVTTVPDQLLEIVNADGHCIGRRPHGHPDLVWAESEPTVSIRQAEAN